MLTHMEHLQAHQLEAFDLEPLDDLSDDAPLHAVGLDGQEGALLQLSHDSETKQRKQRDEGKEQNHLQENTRTHSLLCVAVGAVS